MTSFSTRRGEPAPRGCLPTGPLPDLARGHVMRPPVASASPSSRRAASREGPATWVPSGFRPLSGGSDDFPRPSVRPWTLRVSVSLAGASPFPRPQGSDTIPILVRRRFCSTRFARRAGSRGRRPFLREVRRMIAYSLGCQDHFAFHCSVRRCGGSEFGADDIPAKRGLVCKPSRPGGRRPDNLSWRQMPYTWPIATRGCRGTPDSGPPVWWGKPSAPSI